MTRIGLITLVASQCYWLSGSVAHADVCQGVTSIEIVHRAGASLATSKVRLEPGAGANPNRALRSFQIAADHFGAANVVSSRPVLEVYCAPESSGAGLKEALASTTSGGSLCVNDENVYSCTTVTPSNVYEYGGATGCTASNYVDAVTFSCEDSGLIVTRAGDVVVTVNADAVQADVLDRTQALRRLVGDENVLTNFHFNIVISPDQQAALIGNSAFTNISNQIRQAAELGQPLPDVAELLQTLPDPPMNLAFYEQLERAHEMQQERLQLLAEVTSGARLSPQQINAFYQNFVGRSQLVDRLLVERTANALSRAAELVNQTIMELATTPPLSTIYEQVRAMATSFLASQTGGGLFDPDHVLEFSPPLYQFLTDADMEKRLLAAERLVKANEALRTMPASPGSARDLTRYLNELARALGNDDMAAAYRIYDQVEAAQFFIENDDPSGTIYDVHLTPQARSMFSIEVESTSAVAYDVVVLLNEVARYHTQTGQIAVDYHAIIELSARAALTTPDVIRQLYHTQEAYNWFDVATGYVGGIINSFGDTASGVFYVVTHPVATYEGIKAAIVNWDETLALVWNQGAELIHRWPDMSPTEKADFMGRLTAEIVAGLPAKARQAGRVADAARDAVGLHLDDAAKGIRLIQRSGVALGPRAASELVDRMEHFGINEIDDMIKVADRLDDALPCRIVGGIGGNGLLRFFVLATKPPCDVTHLASVFDSFSATARRMGVTRDIELKDLLLSNARVAPPGLLVEKVLQPHEIAHAMKIVEAKGDTFVGPWQRDLAGIDGFYAGRPAQLKWLQTSADPRGVLAKAEEADSAARRAHYSGVRVFIRAENVERQALIDLARLGDYELVLAGGTVESIDVLVKDDQWVHIAPGRVE